MKKTLFTSLLACAISAPVLADDNSDVELYLGAAQNFFDDSRNLDDATSIEAGIEIPTSESFSFEAWINDFDVDADEGPGDFDGNRYTAGGLYHFTEGDLRPFMNFGLGVLEFDFDGADVDETIAYIGVGVKKYFDNNILLRGEVVGTNSLDEEENELFVRLAIGYAFGRGASAPVVVAEPEPAQEPEPTPEPEVEEKPAPAPVAKVDTDGDGVFDDADQCPGTDSIFKVDEKGCPVTLIEKVSINLDVKFKTNSAELTEATRGEVKELADFLTTYANTKTTVEGHTDDRGRAAYNKQLSQRRAESVKAELVSAYNIDAARIEAVGYGEEQPVATNDTAEGRATNRRVVAQIEAQVKEMQKK